MLYTCMIIASVHAGALMAALPGSSNATQIIGNTPCHLHDGWVWHPPLAKSTFCCGLATASSACMLSGILCRRYTNSLAGEGAGAAAAGPAA